VDEGNESKWGGSDDDDDEDDSDDEPRSTKPARSEITDKGICCFKSCPEDDAGRRRNLINSFEVKDFSKAYDSKDGRKARWPVNYWQAMTPFVGVAVLLILYMLMAYIFRNTCNKQNFSTSVSYFKYNIVLRFLINFYLPMLLFTAMTIRDRDVSYFLSET